jgi:hypothetical protein
LVLQQSYRGVWQQALSVQIGNTSRTAPVRFNAATYEWLPEAAQRYFHPVRYACRAKYWLRLESWCPYTGMQSGACHPATTGLIGSVPFPLFNRAIRPLKKSKTVRPTVTPPLCPSKQSENNHLRYSDTPYPPLKQVEASG